MIRCRALALAVPTFVMAACAGSSDAVDTTDSRADEATVTVTAPPTSSEPVSTTPATEPVATEPVATEPVATEPVATEPVATEPDVAVSDSAPATSPELVPGDLVQTSSSMTDLLGRLPLAAYELATEEGGRSIEIQLVDYDAASATAGLDRPSSDDLEASIDWLVALAQGASVEDGGTGFAIYPAVGFPDPVSIEESSDVEAEIGFSFFDVDSVAALTRVGAEISVLQGNDVVLQPDLIDLGGGIVSAGDGEDGMLDFEQATAARPFGEPLRFAVNNGLVAVSKQTPLVEAWVSSAPSMLDVPALAAAAAGLDRVGVSSAFVIESDFLVDPGAPQEVTESAGFDERFSAIGVGTTVSEGRAANVFVYVFDDEAAASAVLADIDDRWRNGDFVTLRRPVSDVYSVDSVEQVGSSVVVVASISAVDTLRRGYGLVVLGELLFANRP